MFSKYSFLHGIKQSESAMVLILYWSIKLGKIEYSFPPFFFYLLFTDNHILIHFAK